MRGYAGLAKNAVHIGGSVYDKNGAEISGVKGVTVWVQILLKVNFANP